MKLKRNRERMRSICLTWFPIGGYRRTLYIPELDVDYNVRGIYDNMVIFDFDVFLGGVCFRVGLLLYLFSIHKLSNDVSVFVVN